MLPCADTRASSVFNGHKYSFTQRGCCSIPLSSFHNFIFASELRSMRRRCERLRRCECEGVAEGEGVEMCPLPTGCLALAQPFDCSVGSVVPKAGVRLLLPHRAVYYSGAGDRVMCPCCKVYASQMAATEETSDFSNRWRSEAAKINSTSTKFP